MNTLSIFGLFALAVGSLKKTFQFPFISLPKNSYNFNFPNLLKQAVAAADSIPPCAFNKPAAGSSPLSSTFTIGGTVANAKVGFGRLLNWRNEMDTHPVANGDTDDKLAGQDYIIHESRSDPQG